VFPSELFNSTLDANYEEIRSWFGLGPKAASPPRAQAVKFVAFVAAGGVLYALLSPDFRLDLSTLALAFGLSISLTLTTFVFRLPFVIHSVRHHGEWPKLKVLPGAVLVAAACVAISRALHFQPGYLYGLIGGLEARRTAEDTTGRLTSLASLSVLGIGLVSWAAREPVASAAARAGAGFWTIAADACLAAIFVVCLETVVFSMIPMRFLEGDKVTRWSRRAWIGLFASGLFAFVHILLQASSGYAGHTQAAQRWIVVALFAGFGLFSVAFWAYFRYRTPRPQHLQRV
jgi:hypothetical protein